MGLNKDLKTLALVSKETVDIAQSLPHGTELNSKGSHAVKGRENPVEIFELKVSKIS